MPRIDGPLPQSSRPGSRSSLESTSIQTSSTDTQVGPDTKGFRSVHNSLSHVSTDPSHTTADPTRTNTNDSEIEDAGDGTTAEDQVLTGAPLILCALALLMAMFLVALDQTIIATLLETVGAQFDGFGKISWVSSGYLLPTAVLSMNWGKISQVFGRKYTMLVAIVLFEGGSLVCALANSMNMLIGGRVLAGVGGGGIQVLVFVILTEITTLQQRGMFQGLVGAAFGIASVVGPLVGGAFTEHVTWRWCFYINLPIGGVAFAGILFLFHPPRPRGSLKEKLAQIDYLGTFFLCSGLVLVLLAMTFGSTQEPWNSALVISFFVVGGALLVCFCIWNFLFSKHPLIPWFIVKVWRVDLVCFASFSMFGAFMCGVLYLSTFFQVVLNADPLHSGIDLLSFIIPVVICSVVGGIFISKTGITKPICVLAGVVGVTGFGILTLLDQYSDSAKRIGFLILPGIGVGLSMQSMVLNMQTAAPKFNGGVLLATAFLSFFRTLGGAIGSTLGQTVQSVVFKQSLSKKNFHYDGDLNRLVNSPQAIRMLPTEQQDMVIDSFVTGFHGAMYFSLGMFIAYFLFSLFFTNKNIPKSNTAPKADVEQPREEKTQESAQLDANRSSVASEIVEQSRS